MKKKTLIIAIVTIVLAIAGTIFGITYTDEDVEKISKGVETVIKVIETADNLSTTEIPEAYLEDEQNLEEQEIESEGFELQGEIAYNGMSEIPTVNVGDYAGLTYYSQIDSRWKNVAYTSVQDYSQTIGSSGCGPTCSAMVVSSIKGNFNPQQMAELYVNYGYRSANNGTYFSAFRFTADVFNIEYTEKYKLDDVCELLNNNYMVIASCGNGLFTTGGHFILIYGIDGNTLKIYDPYLYSGKFNTSTRRGKVTLDGNTVLCNKDIFREYANYSKFFCFKNTHIEETPVIIKPTFEPYIRYVKVNSSLNVRSGAGTNYSIVGSLYNGNPVTIYEEVGNWAKIGDNRWVSVDYLTDSNVTINNTVGNYYKLKANCNLWSNSNLTGISYSYLKNTQIKIIKKISSDIDYIYVPATGRYAYINNNYYSNNVTNNKTNNTVGQTKYLKSNCSLWSNSNLTGTQYSYLKNTKVTITNNINNSVDKIYVPATKREAYINKIFYK